MQRIFGRQLSPDEMVKKWRQKLRSEERQLERQIRGIETEEIKVKKALKEAATKGNKMIAVMLAKEIIQSRKAKDRLHTSKAQMNSVVMQLQQQLAQVKLAGSLKKSTEIMKMVGRLVKLPEISNVMQEMSQEMMKAGIIEEMMDDVLDLDEPEMEEEAEGEVEKIILELTSETGSVGNVLPYNEEIESVEEAAEMKARLEALKS